MIFNSQDTTETDLGQKKSEPIGGSTLDMKVTDHIEEGKISVPRIGRVFNSNWEPPTEQDAIDADHKSTMSYMRAFLSGDNPESDKAFKALDEHVAQYGDKCTQCKRVRGAKVFNSQPLNKGESGGSRKKLAEFSMPSGSQETFTPDNSHFKTHFRLNQGPMKTKYLKTTRKTGEEPSELADEAFGMGGFNDSGPHPALLGRTLDQFFGIRLRPRVPEGTPMHKKRGLQQQALAVNPEFPSITEDSGRNLDAPHEVTLGHLLQTPSFMVRDGENGTRTLGSTTDTEGRTFDDHPSNALARGGIVERRLYHEAMGRLSSHPDIKVVDGEISWTPEAHKAVQGEVEKYKKDVQSLYHGNGATLQDGTRVRPLYMSKRAASFITDVNEHFEPHPEDAERWQTAMTAFGNVTKGSGIRTMAERAHSPWSQMYDTSFQRRVEDSDDTTLKDVFKEHLGEKGQHRYVASAPVGSFAQETENWKTALGDRLRGNSRGAESSTPELTPTELARSPKPPKTKRQKTFRVAPTPTPIDWESIKGEGTTAKKRTFSSKVKKFFFNSSNSK